MMTLYAAMSNVELLAQVAGAINPTILELELADRLEEALAECGRLVAEIGRRPHGADT